MSYLLDALRKSDEERKRHQQQSAHTRVSFSAEGPPVRKGKLYFGLMLTSFMAVIALTLAAGWWWSHNQTSGPVTAAGNSEQTSPAPLPDARSTIPAVISPPPGEQVMDTPVSQQPPPPLSDTAPIDEIPYLADLSAETRSALPEMQFSGHVYSPSPELRLIMINESVVREGEAVNSDLFLDEITAEGLVLRYRQTRFKVQLF